MRQFYVYILFNRRNGALYVGVTSNLVKRIYEHKHPLEDSFAKRYRIDKLGYDETHSTIYEAITREKQLKAGSREKKIALIENANPYWKDLYHEIV